MADWPSAYLRHPRILEKDDRCSIAADPSTQVTPESGEVQGPDLPPKWGNPKIEAGEYCRREEPAATDPGELRCPADTIFGCAGGFATAREETRWASKTRPRATKSY